MELKKKEVLKNFLTIMNGEYLNIIYYLMNLEGFRPFRSKPSGSECFGKPSLDGDAIKLGFPGRL